MTQATNKNMATLVQAVSTIEPDGTRWIDVYTAPGTIELLGAAIAEPAQALGVNAVVSWLDPDECVLAHAVAARLEVPRAAAELDLGQLTLYPTLPGGSSVLIVGTAFSASRPIASVRALLENAGHTVAAAASLDPESGIVLTTF